MNPIHDNAPRRAALQSVQAAMSIFLLAGLAACGGGGSDAAPTDVTLPPIEAGTATPTPPAPAPAPAPARVSPAPTPPAPTPPTPVPPAPIPPAPIPPAPIPPAPAPVRSIGGNVIGLDPGNVLALRNNGSEDLRVTADGAFSFPTSVADGASYAVTVQGQPSWQSCAVSNGAGSATFAVSNVTVVCTRQAWVTTFAGSGAAGSANGNGANASFNLPSDVAVDGVGNVYVADSENHLIRKITPAGHVTTLAGSGAPGSSNGDGANASFKSPRGLAVDSVGNVYVADEGNHLIRKISPEGDVTTLAGSGTEGAANGNGANASFRFPRDVAVDRSGNVYVIDPFNRLVRTVTPSGDVTNLAGSGAHGSASSNGANASFADLSGVAVDSSGSVYVADRGFNIIWKITSSGDVTTLAGSGVAGSADGKGVNASFNELGGLAVDSSGNVYVGDTINNKIRKITRDGDVTTLAGGKSGAANGNGQDASFSLLNSGVAVDRVGNLYVADAWNNLIRKISPAPRP